jgi:hypothetical protein
MTPQAQHSDLAMRLSAAAARSDSTAPYRLARLVARVLVSSRLRQRRKWCSLAAALVDDPSVEDRLVLQAIGWLQRGESSSLRVS